MFYIPGRFQTPQWLRTATIAGALCASIPVGAGEVVVAQVAPFGGALAVSGRDFNLGAMLAFDEVNSRGGIKGNTIRLVSRDDGYHPAETLLQVKSLLETEEPIALIGMWGSENVEALLAQGVLESAGLPVVGVRSGASTLRSNKYLFHIRASYLEEVHRIMAQIATMGSTRVAVFYEDNGFAAEVAQEAMRSLNARAMKPVAFIKHPKGQLDVTSAIAQLVAVEPQVVLLAANTPVSAAVISAIKTSGSTTFLASISSLDGEQLFTQLGAAAGGVAIAQGMPNPYKASAPIAMAFVNRMRAVGIDPARINFASVEGYIAARVVIEGLKRAAVSNPTRKELVRGLESLHRHDLGGFTLDFANGKREGSSYVDVSILSAGGRLRQ
jgi:branched-chain amino acid transport system substrate-binding protein